MERAEACIASVSEGNKYASCQEEPPQYYERRASVCCCFAALHLSPGVRSRTVRLKTRNVTWAPATARLPTGAHPFPTARRSHQPSGDASPSFSRLSSSKTGPWPQKRQIWYSYGVHLPARAAPFPVHRGRPQSFWCPTNAFEPASGSTAVPVSRTLAPPKPPSYESYLSSGRRRSCGAEDGLEHFQPLQRNRNREVIQFTTPEGPWCRMFDNA